MLTRTELNLKFISEPVSLPSCQILMFYPGSQTEVHKFPATWTEDKGQRPERWTELPFASQTFQEGSSPKIADGVHHNEWWILSVFVDCVEMSRKGLVQGVSNKSVLMKNINPVYQHPENLVNYIIARPSRSLVWWHGAMWGWIFLQIPKSTL